MKYLTYVIMVCMCQIFHAHYYIYPVAFLHESKNLLLIKQTSSDSLELMICNTQTKQIESGLWSLFNPAGLQLLPDETGFSFIDNGRFRLKYFNKRSPKTIDFDNYLYAIHSVHWLTNTEFYCSAKEVHGYSALFECSIDGTTRCLQRCHASNCLYPQKINDHIFYVKESFDKHYTIEKTDYVTHDDNKPITIISDFGSSPIAFLHMISDNEGFIIQYDKEIKADEQIITFHYYMVQEKEPEWEKKWLFSFSIPSYLLLNNNEFRLYESLLPLLPQFVGSKIYFVDALHNKAQHLELFIYDLSSLKVRKYRARRSKKYIHMFVPLVYKSKIFLGGSIC